METALTVIGIVSGVASLFLLVYKPLNNSSLALRENSIANDNLAKAFAEFKEEFKQYKTEEHEEVEHLWAHNRKQDKKIDDHNLRISIIEREVGIDGKGD